MDITETSSEKPIKTYWNAPFNEVFESFKLLYYYLDLTRILDVSCDQNSIFGWREHFRQWVMFVKNELLKENGLETEKYLRNQFLLCNNRLQALIMPYLDILKPKPNFSLLDIGQYWKSVLEGTNYGSYSILCHFLKKIFEIDPKFAKVPPHIVINSFGTNGFLISIPKIDVLWSNLSTFLKKA